MTLKARIFTHHPRVSLARFAFCWWRHNRLAMTSQLPHNFDANTWQVISNSLENDFIHGNIHHRSCKKPAYVSSVRILVYFSMGGLLPSNCTYIFQGYITDTGLRSSWWHISFFIYSICKKYLWTVNASAKHLSNGGLLQSDLYTHIMSLSDKQVQSISILLLI